LNWNHFLQFFYFHRKRDKRFSALLNIKKFTKFTLEILLAFDLLFSIISFVPFAVKKL